MSKILNKIKISIKYIILAMFFMVSILPLASCDMSSLGNLFGKSETTDVSDDSNKEYTISLKASNQNVELSLKKGTKLTLDEINKNYPDLEIEGWYLDSSFIIPVTDEIIITDNMTIYAKISLINDPSHKHDFKIVETLNATCTEEGYKKYVCECGKEKEETLPLIKHKIVIDKGKTATCISEGITEGSHCSVCGTVIKEQQEIPINDKHNFTLIETGYSATCVLKGKTDTYKCTDCGTISGGVETDALGHNPTPMVEWEATCAEEGRKGGTQCITCLQIIQEPTVIPCNDNHSAHLINVSKAYCEVDGYTGDMYCEWCENILSEGEVIPKLGHNFSTSEVIQYRSCALEEITRYHCSNCTKYEDKVTKEALNHVKFIETYYTYELQIYYLRIYAFIPNTVTGLIETQYKSTPMTYTITTTTPLPSDGEKVFNLYKEEILEAIREDAKQYTWGVDETIKYYRSSSILRNGTEITSITNTKTETKTICSRCGKELLK